MKKTKEGLTVGRIYETIAAWSLYHAAERRRKAWKKDYSDTDLHEYMHLLASLHHADSDGCNIEICTEYSCTLELM